MAPCIIEMVLLKRHVSFNIKRMLSITQNVESDRKRTVPLGCERNENDRRILTGIQPTGSLHLGNYFGAVRRWVNMQNNETATKFILVGVVDLHSLTQSQVEPRKLRENVSHMVAELLACGIDPLKTILFQQSEVSQHTQLAWILTCLTTMARLGRLPQYKEKSEKLKEKPLGLFVYPVLQSADILLYKATDVPVGQDQLQHIQLAQHLAKLFNNKYGQYFPYPQPILGTKSSIRLKSLRDPYKKMSKSDPDSRSRVELSDSPDTTADKLKKAITDCTSAVTYDPEKRPAVSNLIDVHCLFTGLTPEQVCTDNQGRDTAHFKLALAEIVNEDLKPTRNRLQQLLLEPDYLRNVLEFGTNRAREIAANTWDDVKLLVGLMQ